MPSQYANCYWRFPSYCFEFMWRCQGSKAWVTTHWKHSCWNTCGPGYNPEKLCLNDHLWRRRRKDYGTHRGTNLAALLWHTCNQPSSHSPAMKAFADLPKELTSPVSGWCLYYMGLFQLFMPDLTKEGTTASFLHHRGQQCVPGMYKAVHRYWISGLRSW